jgi:hypothetical protein
MEPGQGDNVQQNGATMMRGASGLPSLERFPTLASSSLRRGPNRFGALPASPVSRFRLLIRASLCCKNQRSTGIAHVQYCRRVGLDRYYNGGTQRMNQPDVIIGIDLGTTNSVVAVLENEQPKVIVNSEGQSKTPSVVSFMETGEVVVGDIARRQSAVNPTRTVSSIKRLMGRTVADIDSLGIHFAFQLVTHENRLMVRVGEYGYTPPQLSAFVLKKLKEAAQEYLGHPVTKAIITVPAYFDDLQRQATYEAGQLAGLEVLRLLNEPTAAAMAYGLGRTGSERVVVYDFGGGTFDLTVLDITDNTF